MKTILAFAVLALSTVAHGSVAPRAADEGSVAEPIGAQALDAAIAAGAERARSDALLKVSAAVHAKVQSVLAAGDAEPAATVASSVPAPDTQRVVRF